MEVRKRDAETQYQIHNTSDHPNDPIDCESRNRSRVGETERERERRRRVGEGGGEKLQ